MAACYNNYKFNHLKTKEMYRHYFVSCNPAFGAFLRGELKRQGVKAQEFEKACGISKAKLSIIKKG